jgi:hypothetical protein
MAELDEENEKLQVLGDAAIEDIESSKTTTITSNNSSISTTPYVFNGKTNGELLNKNTISNTTKIKTTNIKNLDISTLQHEDENDDYQLDKKPPTPYSNSKNKSKFNNINKNFTNKDRDDEQEEGQDKLNEKKPATPYNNNIEVFMFVYLSSIFHYYFNK